MSIVLTRIIIPDAGNDSDNYPRIGYDTVITEDNVMSDEAASGFPVSNIGNPVTHLKWKAETSAQQSIVILLDEPVTVDYLGLANHNFGTTGTTVTLQYATALGSPLSGGSPLVGSPIGGSPLATWDDIFVNDVISTDNAYIHEFDEITSQAFRIIITPGGGSPFVAPELAVAYLGLILSVPEKKFVGYEPPTLNEQSVISTGYSENGSFLGRVIRSEGLEHSVTFNYLSASWYRENFVPFTVQAKIAPFFYAWRPLDNPDEVAFMWTTSNPKMNNSRGGGVVGFVSVTIDMQGIQ